jgi:hypothetical protein
MSNRGNYIENEVAYEAARERNIRANARVGRERRWLAEDATRQQLIVFIDQNGRDDDGQPRGTFLGKMAESFEEWGTLTAGQEAAVRKIVADRAEKQAERKAADAQSKHIGTVGERRTFTATVRFATFFDTQFGTTFVTGLNDADGNIIIHKGSAVFPSERGAVVNFVATVKEHGVRDGVNQTIVARPKVAA